MFNSMLPAGYRVMVRRANGEVALLRVLWTRSAAQGFAKRVSQRHLAKLAAQEASLEDAPSRPREVFVEAWEGNLTEGHWSRLPRWAGESSFRFPVANASADVDAKPRFASGQTVHCVLLAKKTRRGGWRAQIQGTRYIGPVTNSRDIPAEIGAGEHCMLRIAAISLKTSVTQFAWVEGNGRSADANANS